MRKIVLYTLLSVDGVAEAPETFVVDFDAEMNANPADVIGTQDAFLLGRVMYDEWARYWPTATEQPFANFINAVQKYVATSTPPGKTWANTSVIDGSITDFVRDLKSQPGGDIGIHGSIMLAQSLMTVGLIDELRRGSHRSCSAPTRTAAPATPGPPVPVNRGNATAVW